MSVRTLWGLRQGCSLGSLWRPVRRDQKGVKELLPRLRPVEIVRNVLSKFVGKLRELENSFALSSLLYSCPQFFFVGMSVRFLVGEPADHRF